MYQNAPPPHYNQGYGAPSPPPPQNPYGGGGPGGGGGYYDNSMPPPPQQQQQGYNNNPAGGGYGNPSPVNAAYQRANAAMARGPSPANSNPNNSSAPGGPGGGGTASGLIRLTLRKPMGIVFEPMTDPHNPSQQRGVRICDLPRTGAAAMSQKLEVGDALLSINDKTMSRLTFDEIMDFIIEADKERVDLLFRRPGKNKDKSSKAQKATPSGGPPGAGGQGEQPLSPMGLVGIGSNSNSVKWIDEKSDMGGKLTEDVREPEMSREHGGGRGISSKGGGNNNNNSRGGGNNSKNVVRDDPSVDDTYNDGYTVESQSQYTMETYEDDRGRAAGGGNRGGGRGRYDDDVSKEGKHRRNNRSGRDHHRSDHHNSKRKSSSVNDPVESSGFLDLLIDTLCTSVMGRDARDMCGDRSEKDKSTGSDHSKNKYDEDDEFTMDDGTYATYEENDGNNRRMRDEESEDEETFVTTDDDGTRTLESKDIGNSKKSHQIKDSHSGDKKDLKKMSSSKSKSKDPLDVHHLRNDIMDDANMQDPMAQFRSFPPPHGVQSFQQAPDPPSKTGSQIHASATSPAAFKQQQMHQQHQHHGLPIIVDHQMNEQESAIASGMVLPVKELEYDDRVDDVSVMESLGGPSLLVERARHENAMNSGYDRASFENLDRQDPELAELVDRHGDGFMPDGGMTKEETAFRDPYKFYEFAVCALLRDNEPEKVRLLSKLMAKYRGRERHLINKLSARYSKEGGDEQDHVVGSGDQEASAPSVERAKSNASENNGGGNKLSVSGMELIHEGDDGEEETAGSSALNDPSRANMAAIETAKKKMESNNANKAEVKGATSRDPSILNKKSSNDDGWPPAMSDPWGTSSGQAGGTAGVGAAPPTNTNEDEMEGASRPIIDHDDDEGSYSDGSSYTEDDDEVDGTSPAIIAQVSELLNYVYGKTSVAGQIDRVSTIMRAYEGREAVLLELLETKALIKANADSNRGDNAADLPISLRNSPGLNNATGKATGEGNNNNDNPNESSKKLTPQTPVSVLTAPTMVEYPGPISPATMASPKDGVVSPSSGTLNTLNTTASSKKKKKGIFGGFFGGKKKDKKGGNFPSSDQSTATGGGTGSRATSSPPGKNKKKMNSKKGQMLNNNEDDRSI